MKDRLKAKPVIKIQVKTLTDGVLHMTKHDSVINFPRTKTIENPCPEVCMFEILEDIVSTVYKVEINGLIFCLKIGPKKELLWEFSAFAKMTEHPSLPRLIGVVNARQGLKDQFVTTLIFGKSLAEIITGTDERQRRWKTQISEAIKVL